MRAERDARRSDVNMDVAFIIPESAHGGARDIGPRTTTDQYICFFSARLVFAPK